MDPATRFDGVMNHIGAAFRAVFLYRIANDLTRARTAAGLVVVAFQRQ